MTGMPHLGDMVNFAAIVRGGSLAAASRQLGMPVSTLSRRLSALEQRLGVRLLDRTTRSLRLTEAGEAYYERCARIAAEAAEADSLVRSHGQAPRGLLRITAPPALGTLFLGRPLTEYLERCPEVRVEVVLHERTLDLREDGFDVALRIGELPSDGSYIIRRLGHCGSVLCASPAYLKAHGTPRTLADLEGHELIGLGMDEASSRWRFVDASGHARQCLVEPRLRVNNALLAQELCLEGAGIALLTRFLAEAHLQSGALVALELEELPAPVGVLLVLQPASASTPKVRALVEVLQRWSTLR
ncbi:MAG TPA: LysR family transcriptional regulator [Myxococcus sp.]|nr:LysR family transcriptional regulator [Myxococcus sp.]